MGDFTPSPERGRLAYFNHAEYEIRYSRNPRHLRADMKAYLLSDLYRADLAECVRRAIEEHEAGRDISQE